MVAIFTGSGAGFERGSGSVLGGAGLLGSAAFGRSGEQVFLNAANGNLLISRRDEFLVGRGPDVAISRTYNSLGDMADDNGDNWRQSTDRRIFDLEGAVNSIGSSVKRRSGDGSDSLYTWNGSIYVSSDGAGSFDTLSWNGSWVWTDGDSRVTETYNAYGNHWRIDQQADLDGHTLSFTYSGDKLVRVQTADGGWTEYAWSGNAITQITTGSHERGLTRTRYSYDAENRLSAVIVDLSPEDGSIADENVYLTTYTYHGSTKLVASISESDGSKLQILYDAVNRVQQLTQDVANGVTRITSLSYGQNHTIVTDASGSSTRLDYSPGDFALPLERWATGAIDTQPAMIDGAAATRFAVSAGGGWGGVYQGFDVSAGETVTFGLTLQGTGAASPQLLGLYQDGWGDRNASSARIVSGPGQLVQWTGGLWAVVGLSTTESTRVEITRTYTAAGSSGAYLYVDLEGGHRPGMAVLAAKPTLLKSATAVSLAQMDLGNWDSGGVTREAIGTIDGNMAYKYTVQQSGSWAGISTGLMAKGDTHSFSLSLQAVGEYTSHHLGLYGNSSGWGSDAAASARIVSGPGTISRWVGGLFVVSGLSSTEPTRVEVTRTYDRTEIAGAYFYDDLGGNFRAGAALIAHSPHLLRRLSEPPVANQLTRITTVAPHANAAPQVVQFAYDADGNLAAVTDANANTTSYSYDAAGNLTSQTDSLGNVVTRTYGSRNELLTETRSGSDQASGAAQHTTRYVYDAANRLRFVVSAQGAVSEFWYNSLGQLVAEAQHTNLFVNVNGLVPSTPLSEAQMLNWRDGLDKSQLKILENRYDVRGNLTERISYGGSDWYGHAQTGDGYKHEYFTFDQAGQLLTKTTAGLSTEHFVYDGLGRVRSTTDLNGGTTSIVFNDASLQTVVTLANGFVQTSTYNKAGELIAFTESGDFPNGATATYRYDQLGRLRMATDATGLNTYFLYDKIGRKVADINHYGHVIEYRYDGNDRLVAMARYAEAAAWALPQLQNPDSVLDVSQIRPAAHTSDVWNWNVYDSAGRLIQTIDGTGCVVSYEYDASARLIRTTSYATRLAEWRVNIFKNTAPAGLELPGASGADKVARTFYDKDGLIVGSLDGEGYLFQIIYDGAGQKVQEVAYARATQAHLRQSHSFDDLLANLATPSQDRNTRFVYDGQGLLRFTINSLNQVTEFRYEAGGTWTAIGALRETIEYAGAIDSLDTYTVGSVRGALASAGLSGHGSNRVSRNVLDASGKVAYTIDAGGAVSGFVHDALGQVIKTVQFANFLNVAHVPGKSEMDNWAGGNANAADRITRNYYSARGALRFVIDAEGFVSRNDHDAEGRVVRTVRWAHAVAATDGWDIHAVEAAAVGPSIDNNFTYDAAGRLAWSYDGGIHRHFAYHASGALAWDIAAPGHAEESRTYYEYDAAGRMIAEHRAHGSNVPAVTRYGYDGHGNLVLVNDPNGNDTSRSYDRLGRIVSQTNAEGGVSSYGYNAFGEVARVVDARGHSTFNYHDSLGRVTHVRDAEDYVTETAYTPFGEIDSITRRYNKTWNGANHWDLPGLAPHHLDATTRFEYDRLGRLVKKIDAEGDSNAHGSVEHYYELYTLDAFGQRTHVRNRIGGVTVNQYDRRGLLVAETLPMNSTDGDGVERAVHVTNRFEYDARGNRTRMIEAAGGLEQRTTTYVYDSADRLIETRGDAVQVVDQDIYHVSGDFVPVEKIRYDARGNVIETIDANDARTLYFYDKQNRKVEQIDALNNMVSWRYDPAGNMVHERRWALKAPWPQANDHGWPAITDQDRVTDYSYDSLGRLKRMTLREVRNGSWDEFNFTGRIGDVTTHYDHDAAGNLVGITDANGGYVHTWYDRLGRKVAQLDQNNYITGWVLDGEGNVIHERRFVNQPTIGITATVPWLAEYIPAHAEDRCTNFTYDRNGRRISERRWADGRYDGTPQDSIIHYAYNGLGQVIRKTEATAQGLSIEQHSTEYSYDSAGRLVREARAYLQLANGLGARPTTEYFYDGLNNLTRTRQSGERWQDATPLDARITRYEYKAGGRLAKMWDANGAEHEYFHDIAGNLLVQSWHRKFSNGSQQRESMLYTRDIQGRVVTQALASLNGYHWAKSDIQHIAYNVWGEVSAKGVNGLQEQFGYDNAGRLDRSNAGDGVWRYYMYDGVGNQTLMVENEGDADLVDRTTDYAVWRATQQHQTLPGNVYIDGLNSTITIYDRRNQAVETQLRQRQLNAGTISNLSIKRSYNAFGEVATEHDARGHETRYRYNTLGRTVSIERPEVVVVGENGVGNSVRPTETFEYDRSGRLVASTDANGNRTARALLNGTGYGGTEALVTAEYRPDGGVAQNFYDHFADVRRAVDAIGRARTMDYDAMGRLIREEHPNGLIEAYAYDLLGQRIHHYTSYHNYHVTTDYDVQGRITRQVDFGGDATSFSYQWHGGAAIWTPGMAAYGGWQKITTHEANGRQSLENSDMFGRVVWTKDLGGHISSYTYDLAGRLAQRSGGETLTYTYLNTGRLGSVSTFSGSHASQNWASKSTTYGYDAAGNLTSEYTVDQGEKTENLSSDLYEPNWYLRSWTHVLQNATADYDALGRMAWWKETGSGTTPAARVDYTYDANGNVRSTTARHQQLNSHGNSTGEVTRTYWNRFDSMNRVVVDKGIQTASGISRGWQGVDYLYNQAGERVSSRTNASLTGYAEGWIWYPEHDPDRTGFPLMPGDPNHGYHSQKTVSYVGEREESYAYDAAGMLASVKVAETGYQDNGDGTVSPTILGAERLLSNHSYDNLGRLTRQIDYKDGAAAYDRSLTYNAKGQVISEETISRQGAETWKSEVVHQFGQGTGYALGAVTQTSTTDKKLLNGVYQQQFTTTTTTDHAWHDGAVASKVKFSRTDQPTYSTDYFYNGLGHLTSAKVNDGRQRTITFTNDMNGQALRREEADNVWSAGDPHEIWYRFGGRQMGYVGNNGTLATDYATSVENRMKTQGTGAFRFGASAGAAHADFAQSLAPINSYGQGGAGGSYTARAGETLAGIAAQLWGDASLWYKLAQANGLGAHAALIEGQRLTVPAGVMKNSHNAGTFRPYDPAEILGDLNPTSPQPQAQARTGNKCGAFGAILLVAIAVAVTIATSGALAAASISAAGGGSLSLGAGIGAAFGGVTATGASLTTFGLMAVGAGGAAVGSFVSQGVGVATRMQDRIDWKNVAIAGLSAAIGGGMGKAIPGTGIAAAAARGAAGSALTQGIAVATRLQPKFDWAGVAAAAAGSAVASAVGGKLPSLRDNNSITNHLRHLGTGAASAIANGAARSLLTGTSFGDNILAALPDVIGSTIGNMVAHGVNGSSARAEKKHREVVEHLVQNRPEALSSDENSARRFADMMLSLGVDAKAVAAMLQDKETQDWILKPVEPGSVGIEGEAYNARGSGNPKHDEMMRRIHGSRSQARKDAKIAEMIAAGGGEKAGVEVGPFQILGGSAAMRAEVAKALEQVLGTPRGREMRAEAERTKRVERIILTKGSVPSSGLNGIVVINLAQKTYSSTTRGILSVPLTALIAHELGHALFNTRDNGVGQMNNVKQNENPVRKALGLPLRTKYGENIDPRTLKPRF